MKNIHFGKIDLQSVFKKAACLPLIASLAVGMAQAKMPTAADLAVSDQARAAAQAGLASYRVMAASLGDEDTGALALGVPLRDYTIALDDLKAYKGGDPGDLLIDTKTIVFPISRSGWVVAQEILEYRDGQWQPEEFEGADQAKAEDAAVKALPASNRAAPIFQVRIPALSAIFISRVERGQLVLLPLHLEPNADLIAGPPAAAKEMLLRLKQEAQRLGPIN